MKGNILARWGLVTIVALGGGSIPRNQVVPSIDCKPHLLDMLDDNIELFLLQDFRGFSNAQVPQIEFRIIALSNLADGIRNISETCPNLRLEAAQALEKIVRVAMDPRVSPYHGSLVDTIDLGNNGEYLGHLNIILGDYASVAQSNRFFELNRRVSEYLARGSLADPQRHFRSYPNTNHKWPADQAAILYSLYLFDANFGERLSDEPTREWLEYMRESATDSTTGLHFSEVTTRHGRTPRGCALSSTIRYMAYFVPQDAAALWENYKRYFYDDGILVSGFREWPRGVNGNSDDDSGPIVMGIGVAASAFGIGASRAMGDSGVYTRLKDAEGRAELYIDFLPNEKLRRASNNFLSSSIRLSSDTTPRLYNP